MGNTIISVFISYAREDQELALRLYRDLKQSGAEPWMDSENLLPGQVWRDEIKKAIRNSGYFVAIFSSKSVNKKGFFQKEVRMAMNELEELPPGKTSLIPCRADDVVIKYESLKELHWLDFFPSYSNGLKKLKLSIGILSPEKSDLTDYRELIKQMDQNIFKYKLSQTKSILNQPWLFQNPTWISRVELQTGKTLRRLYETITRVQMTIPMYNYEARGIGNQQFILVFKHDKDFGSFAGQLKGLLLSEGVKILDIRTKKDEIPKGHSALIIPPNDAEAVMIRGSSGRTIFASSEGAYDAETSEKVSDEELENLSPHGGVSITKGK